MAESKVRKGAREKLKARREAELQQEREARDLTQGMHTGSRSWVPWTFIPLGLVGVVWMVLYNLAGSSIGVMRALGDWNVLIALGLIIASFSFMTLWK